MATTRNAVLRYNTLDKCFNNIGRKYSFEDLLEKVNQVLMEFDPGSPGIKTRQLRDDLRFMKSEAGYSAPIIAISEGRKSYYCYEEKNYSINNSPLNKTEAEQLKNAISILQRFDGAPSFEWISELAPMLTDRFGLKNSEQKVMSYDSNIDYTGYDKIQSIFNAIVNKRVLEVEYQPFNKPAFSFEFHPYYLKQFNNRWFAFGLNKMLNIETWNLALDRILNLNESFSDYIETSIDWEDHFYDIIGVTREELGQVEEIELIFSKEQANYINTKPLHPSQKAKFLETGDLQVVLKLIPNYELEMILLSFGEKVKIIRPNALRLRIINIMQNALKRYDF
ncbi:MAG: WYL domain-containing protein [Bacteroidales bacterium]|jgi:predicted DNA-binding transcriptional regulator YafY|nr:WYL domain-containing protein [Bacteroidales bacterium]